MDRGAWQAAVYWLQESDTTERLSTNLFLKDWSPLKVVWGGSGWDHTHCPVLSLPGTSVCKERVWPFLPFWGRGQTLSHLEEEAQVVILSPNIQMLWDTGFSAENLCTGNPLSSTLTFLQANCLAENKKPGLIPPSLPPASAPPWDTIRWITDEDGDHQLEFFQEEACAVVLRPIASSLRCRYF